jgi:hypothetical protein
MKITMVQLSTIFPCSVTKDALWLTCTKLKVHSWANFLFYADKTWLKLNSCVLKLKELHPNRYNRAEVIQSFRWKIGPVLPHDIQEKLHFSEKEYFKNHSAAIKSYISEMDIDLTVVRSFFSPFFYFLCFLRDEIPDSLYLLLQDMVPPKDPYIQVRVLEDIGEVSLGDHSVSLTKNSLHFLRRTDAEQFISQVCSLFLCDDLVSLSPLVIIWCELTTGSYGRISGVGITCMNVWWYNRYDSSLHFYLTWDVFSVVR